MRRDRLVNVQWSMYKKLMRKQEFTVLIVAGIDIISIVIKFFLAVLTGSLSLLADAWHSISDLATSVMVFLALILDRKEAIVSDAQDDRGTHKPRIIRRSSWEPRVCVVIGLALIAVSASVFKKVYSQTTVDPMKYPAIAVIVILGLMVLSYIRYKFEESVGQETDSAALIADANHSKVDLYVLALVLVSFVSELIQVQIDRWIAAIIALFILIIAIKTIYGSLVAMFRLSKETVPEHKTIEDRIMLLTGTGFEKFYDSLKGYVPASLRCSDQTVFSRLVRNGLYIIAGVLGLAWVLTGFFQVSHRELAIVERFGTPVNMQEPVGPGLHFTWPFPVCSIRRVDVQSVKQMRLGYEVQEGSRSGEYILWTNAHYKEEYALISGDGAIIDFAANMHYQITDPAKFLYACFDPVGSLKVISNQTLRDIAGVRPLFELLTHDRDAAEQWMLESVQEFADKLNLGITVRQVCFRDMHPPLEVAPAFEDVVSAQEDQETFIEQALGYKKDLVPIARSEAHSLMATAQAYKTERIMKSQGKSLAFTARREAFERHLTVNKFRMRMEALESWLAASRLWIIDEDAIDDSLKLMVTSASDSSAETILNGIDLDEGENSFE